MGHGMIHFHYVGYFDPTDPLDLAREPVAPKPIRSLPDELLTRLAQRFGVTLGNEIVVQDGYVVSRLGHEGELHPLEAALVAEGCVVMTQEPCRVVQPRDAVTAFWRWIRARPVAERPPVLRRPIAGADSPSMPDNPPLERTAAAV